MKKKGRCKIAYKTVKESFWTDPKVRQLSSEEKLLLLYCITGPSAHYSGLYYLPITFMMEETGLPQKTLNQCLTNLESKLMIRYDKVTSTIFVVKMFKHQNSSGGNPKVIKSGIEKQLQNIHSSILIDAFVEEYQYLNLTLPQGYANVDATLLQCSSSVSVTDTVSVKKGIVKGKQEKPKTLIPADFQISDQVRSWAIENKHNRLEERLAHFIDWAKSGNKEYFDWDATFRNSIRGDWAHLNKTGQKGETLADKYQTL